ncbi:hypothetical protein G7Y89_g1800 [Cudoniella acicularis]|uniref:NADP-dependent oxidoreductase domain-containing protein n=1 Tax=Cudoniella acicularis TaxID=354080 RepID=A0A8H4RW99_9HELO|nr:hypothetical protein G7Y89_g1800 [Cudoniella acicularis]
MPFPPSPPPKKVLGQYRMLAPNASVRVSPLCLGSMNFGDAWEDFMGKCDKETTEQILDYFYEAGGNFIDTSNNYQDEESEIWIGEWMKKRGNRDQMVIATKFTTCFRTGHDDEIIINTTGNGTKSLHVSLEASLKKLQTTYIDLLYVHWWDFTCSIPELMQSLNTVVAQGKVLYLGISDTPAWVVSKANEYARQNGLRQFSVYQGRWSAEHRDFERDIIPMVASEGMGLAPWGALGGGNFKTEEQRASQEGRKNGWRQRGSDQNQQGGRKLEHLKGNIDALKLSLTDEDIEEIEGANAFDIGFPHNFLGGPKGVKSPGGVWLMGMAGHQQHVAWPKAIGPTN